MAEIVELVAKKTVARAVEIRKRNARASSGHRSVRLARKAVGEVASSEDSPAAALKEPEVAQRVVVGEFGSDVPVPPEVSKEGVPESGEGRYRPKECLQVYEVEGGAAVVEKPLRERFAKIGIGAGEKIDHKELPSKATSYRPEIYLTFRTRSIKFPINKEKGK